MLKDYEELVSARQARPRCCWWTGSRIVIFSNTFRHELITLKPFDSL